MLYPEFHISPDLSNAMWITFSFYTLGGESLGFYTELIIGLLHSQIVLEMSWDCRRDDFLSAHRIVEYLFGLNYKAHRIYQDVLRPPMRYF